MILFEIKENKIYPRTGHEDPRGGVKLLLCSFFNLGAII
jgi:hypothetical protein